MDGTNYISSWYTVERNGKYEYYTPNIFMEAGFHSWDISAQPGEGLGLWGIRDKTAYFIFAHNNVYDVYLFDIVRKEGKFMSGANAEDFSAYYEKETEYLQSRPSYAYLNYYIVSMPPESDFALMCRTKKLGEQAGEYYMRNLKTGKETYICDSYTREMIISYMEEYYEWIDENHLRISVFLEYSHPTYDVIYNGKTWTTALLPEEN